MNQKYSASRFGCYKGCLLKYKYTYVDELTDNGTRPFDLATKGLVFHEIAEETQIGESFDSIMERAKKVIDAHEYDKTKYPIEKAIPRFYYFWKNYVEKYVNEGYELYKEEWKNDTIAGEPLCGAIDLLLVNRDHLACDDDKPAVIIFDYKSGSSAKIGDYSNQLTLYAYMMARELGISLVDIPKKIKSYLFFPLAGLAKADDSTEEKMIKNTLKNILEYRFSLSEFETTIMAFEKIVNDTKERDWNSIDPIKDATIEFGCSFCIFSGHPKYCPVTYNAGVFFPHSAKIKTKQEWKAMEEDAKKAAEKAEDEAFENYKKLNPEQKV